MPIFMDHHDAPEGATKENIAKLHRRDLEVRKALGDLILVIFGVLIVLAVAAAF